MSQIIRLIGDVHGRFHQYERILKESPHPTIQVGDMGLGFLRWPHGNPSSNPPHARMLNGGHRFIRGNHDNPGACRKHTQWIEDGHYEDGMFFLGGAVSVDKAYMIEGFSWWPEEELSIHELNKLIDRYIDLKPKIMVTHDCPEQVAQELARISLRIEKLDPRFDSRTRHALQAMWSAHPPKIWIFGHWHTPFDRVLNGTRFICLPELEWMDVDVTTAETATLAPPLE